MGSRTMTTVVTADTMALNAAMFGFAGHSLVTPHAAIQQIWWTEERISAKVTRDVVFSKLRPANRILLDRHLAFGDGLTDDTYLDWILSRARRFFLILVECGIPEQIFGIVDNSWDDDDLPVPLADVERLRLSPKPDERLNKKFYSTQFQFLLRQLHEGDHIDYAPNEVIPIEYVHRRSPAAALQHWLRIHMPKEPDTLYMKRRMSLGKEERDPVLESQFHADVAVARSLKHAHIVPLWASYTSKTSGYILTDFLAEHTLKSFIEFRTPASLTKTTKSERHSIMLGWMHCLADALAWLHQNGICHGAIMPSNIVVDASNQVAFSDIGSLKVFQTDKKRDPAEPYNYGAPENHPLTSFEEPIRPMTSSGRSWRKRTAESKAPSDGKSIRSYGSQSFDGRSVSDKSVSSHGSRTASVAPSTAADLSIYCADGTTPGEEVSPTTAAFPEIPSSTFLPPTAVTLSDPNFNSGVSNFSLPLRSSSPRPAAGPPPVDEKSDIFSLGCIFLDILSFISKKKPYSDFTKYRSTKHKQAKGMRTDQSFHANTDNVSTWMEMLEHEAFDNDDAAFRAMPYLLALIRPMLSRNPKLRPTASDVRNRLASILTVHAKIQHLHCGPTLEMAEPSLTSAPPTPALEQSPDQPKTLKRAESEPSRPSTAASEAPLMATGNVPLKPRLGWRRRLIGAR